MLHVVAIPRVASPHSSEHTDNFSDPRDCRWNASPAPRPNTSASDHAPKSSAACHNLAKHTVHTVLLGSATASAVQRAPPLQRAAATGRPVPDSTSPDSTTTWPSHRGGWGETGSVYYETIFASNMMLYPLE